MDLYPAIDLRGGHVVRLHQGDFERETVYGDDPVAVAEAFAAAGARWIHVVDLDAARTGEPRNRNLVGAMAAAVGPHVRLQVGGGARDRAAAEALFDVGVSRVVIGTAAIENPSLVGQLANRYSVAVGLDVHYGQVMVRGWADGSGRRLVDVIADLDAAGAEAFVVTDISRDATLEGPSIEVLTEALQATKVDIIASGGVGTLVHLGELAALAVEGRALAGVIVGKALHDGRFGVEEAIAACAVSG